MISYRFEMCSSLEKVFPDKRPGALKGNCLSGFHGERVSVQLAYYVDHTGTDLLEEELELEVRTVGGIKAALYQVGLAPSGFPCDGAHDEDYISTRPGMFPDILYPLREWRVRALWGQWRAVWIELEPGKSCPDGWQEVEVAVRGKKGEILYKRLLEMDVLPGQLPEQDLIHTEFFHGDCLADYYHVEVFSESHWRLIESFIRTAAERGVNMVLTPLFTPPLDTGVGLDRTTIQLVEVEKREGRYRFGFEKLDRFIRLARECGMVYFEMAHLFSQWGARYAPKVLAWEDGEEKQIFGWDTLALDPPYMDFLRQFLPRLREFLEKKGVLGQVWFHVSDEPVKENLEGYQKAYAYMEQLLPGCRFLDAISDFDFYELGIIKNPVVSIDHMEPFIQAGVKGLWAYYCCVQGVDVSNRFFAMPSYRNRILGVQLYLYEIRGFLHWGYNFYNSRFSKTKINPFAVTDCGENFPSGDAFLVYPGEDGEPVLSIRFAVLEQGLNDLRALKYLESLTSREYVIRRIEELGGAVTWKQYPRNQEFLLELRQTINEDIKKSFYER